MSLRLLRVLWGIRFLQDSLVSRVCIGSFVGFLGFPYVYFCVLRGALRFF